jgi:hypothetical protein
LKIAAGPERHPASAISNQFAGQSLIEEPVPQPGFDLGDDPPHRLHPMAQSGVIWRLL